MLTPGEAEDWEDSLEKGARQSLPFSDLGSKSQQDQSPQWSGGKGHRGYKVGPQKGPDGGLEGILLTSSKLHNGGGWGRNSATVHKICDYRNYQKKMSDVLSCS